MASTRTSRSACIVRITTWVPGTRSRTWRVASTPSRTGMVTSIRMTSGCSSPARRTASAPSGASPTTSKPLSSMARRNDSRSMRWSSASSRRIGAPAVFAVSAVIASGGLQPAAHGRAPPLYGFEFEHGPDGVGPLAHAEHAVGVDASGPPDGEAVPVVLDDQQGAGAVAAPLHAQVLGLGVALYVADRLLGDAPHLPLLGDGQTGRLL